MFPLVRPFFIGGAIAAIAGGLIFRSPLAAFVLFVVFGCAGLLWMADQPAMLPFAIGFQSVFIAAGLFYTQVGGELLTALPESAPRAILLSVLGLLCLTIGLRAGLGIFQQRLRTRAILARLTEPPMQVVPLFWAVVIAYSVSWGIEISPMKFFYQGAQIISSVLNVREVLFCMLWLTILGQRKGYHYGWVALVVAIVPRFISKQSSFKELLFTLLVVVLAELKPWVRSAEQRGRNIQLGMALAVALVLLTVGGVVWEGAIKPNWRHLEVEGTPLEKLEIFATVTETATLEMEEETGIQALISRLSSVTQFSLVLDRVPRVVAHEDGFLTMRAIKHVLVPRILYPEKESLGLDSWLPETYAGMTISEGTSVGIGYMAEFYVDWGVWGMFVSLIVMGAILGVIYAVTILWSPTYTVGCAVVVIPFMGNFISYEATLPKLMGGLIMNTIILLFVVRLIPRFAGAGDGSSLATLEALKKAATLPPRNYAKS